MAKGFKIRYHQASFNAKFLSYFKIGLRQKRKTVNYLCPHFRYIADVKYEGAPAYPVAKPAYAPAPPPPAYGPAPIIAAGPVVGPIVGPRPF